MTSRASPFPKNVEATIYQQTGRRFRRHQIPDKAHKSLEKVLEINPQAVDAKYELSRVKSELVEVKEAKKLAGALSNDENFRNRYNQRRIECNYDLNEFEEALKAAVNAHRETEGLRHKDQYAKDVEVIRRNFEFSVGEYAGPCLLQRKKIIEKIQEKDAQKVDDSRPMWKILRDRRECDVLSIREEKQEQVSKLRKHLRDQKQKQIDKIYLGSSMAKEIQFLKRLTKSPAVSLRQSSEKTQQILRETERGLNQVLTCREMLRHRQPLYSEIFMNKSYEKEKQKMVFRNQLKTREQAFNQLDKAKKLAMKGIQPLLEFVEEIMKDFYSVKTTQVFPRKLEFTNELYNLVGLTYLKDLKVPKTIRTHSLHNQMLVLLHLPIEDKTQLNPEPKFGDRSTFRDPTMPNMDTIRWKKASDAFEDRSKFAFGHTEQCYLLHERAKMGLKLGKFEETRALGKKIVEEEAEKCSNWVWKMLGILMKIRSNAVQGNLERNEEDILTAIRISDHLDGRLRNFVELLGTINGQMLDERSRRK